VAIYREGIYSGLFRMLMVWSASSFGLLFIATTHPSDMFVALQRIGVPYELNFMVAASLQLIPILQKEFGAVLQAQQSRGLRVSGFGAALPSLVPVFSATVERVQQLALSLEARAFGSVGVKTNLREVSVSAKDYVAGALGMIVPASLGVFTYRNRHLLDWSKIQLVPDPVAVMLVIGSGALFLATLLRVLWIRRSE
jgi:energy-coupling factor transport system permease protein